MLDLFGIGSSNALAPKKPATIVLSHVPPEETAKFQERFAKLEAELQSLGVPYELCDSVYDLHEDDPRIQRLHAIKNDLVFVGWHFPRATKWILARQNLEVNGATRKLHCVDARDGTPAQLAAKLKDILAGKASAVIDAPPKKDGPVLDTSAMTPHQRGELAELELAPPENAELSPRWYPVIDYDTCTNCMECLDFCLFGVYGVDHAATLRVTQQDQCRQDCPACSRVCPVGAIIFPKYQTNQTIAGANTGGDRGEIKLDLSKIFGKPKARHTAAMERDQELLKAGRKPVGTEKVEKLAEAIEKMEL